MTNFRLRLILADVRGAGNVGSLLRTADAATVELVYASGLTPYPPAANDPRPPHVIESNRRAIAKTALGAEKLVPVLHTPDTSAAIRHARDDGYTIIMIEQTEKTLMLYDYHPPAGCRLALVLGSEVGGLPPSTLQLADHMIELPMAGRKESLNVAVAGAVVLYHLRFGL